MKRQHQNRPSKRHITLAPAVGVCMACSWNPAASDLEISAPSQASVSSAATAPGASTVPSSSIATVEPSSSQVEAPQVTASAVVAAPSLPSSAASSTAVASASPSSSMSAPATPNAAQALAELATYLEAERETRPPLADEPFASVPLDRLSAETAQQLLWNDHVEWIRATRQEETEAKLIAIGDKQLRYDYKIFGEKPANGRSLYISLHGGGETEASVNDEQWENQKVLYQPEEGLYLAPRAPTNTWNLWHEPHIDPLFYRLIENLIVFEEVDPNRVYVMGYSAGGDGVYQLGPRMADSWAAAAMMAGHPNDAMPDSLRNIGFTIHVGGLDTAFDRNTIAPEWDEALNALQAEDPEGYPHLVQVHANKPHWMDLEDAVAVPWMAEFTRQPLTRRVVWLQDDVPHDRFYWLAVSPDDAEKGDRCTATLVDQSVELTLSGVSRLKLRFSDAMLDLDQSVTVTDGAAVLFEGVVPRTIQVLHQSLTERGDPALVFSAELEVTAP
jgi:hypothetical protein